MADLSPDLSIYHPLAQATQGGLGSMGLDSLLGVAARARQLQTQSAISDALKGSVDPSTGQPNASSAISGLLRNPNAVIGSDDIAHLNSMQEAQAKVRTFNLEQAGKAAAAFYNEALAGTATPEKAHALLTMMAGWGTPPDQLAQFHDLLLTPDGKVNKQGAHELWSISSGGGALPTVPTQLSTGVKGNIPAAAAQSGPGGFVPIEIPGATAAAEADPVTSANLYKIAQAQSNNYQEEIQPLKEMHRLAVALGPQGLGQGTGVLNTMKNFLITSGAADALGMDKDKAYNYQDLQKFVKRYADQMSQGGTDARLMQAVGGNPNLSMNQQAILPVIRYLTAMRRMRQVAYSEYNTSHMNQMTGKVDAGDFGNWTSSFLQNQDRRAYAFDLMEPDARKKLLLDVRNNKATSDRFDASLAVAEKHGLADGGL